MKHYRTLFACALACALVACKDAVAPHGTTSDLNGMWTEDFGPTFVAGNSFAMGLHESAEVVSGQGSYAGEAGPYGLLSISGSARADSVHLGIVFTPNAVFPQLKPDTARFDGVLATRDRIDGTLARGGGPPRAFSLIRLRGDPI